MAEDPLSKVIPPPTTCQMVDEATILPTAQPAAITLLFTQVILGNYTKLMLGRQANNPSIELRGGEGGWGVNFGEWILSHLCIKFQR